MTIFIKEFANKFYENVAKIRIKISTEPFHGLQKPNSNSILSLKTFRLRLKFYRKIAKNRDVNINLSSNRREGSVAPKAGKK